MAFYLPPIQKSPSFGTQLAHALGTAGGELIKKNYDKVQTVKTIKALEDPVNQSPIKQAELLSQLPDKVAPIYLKNREFQSNQQKELDKQSKIANFLNPPQAQQREQQPSNEQMSVSNQQLSQDNQVLGQQNAALGQNMPPILRQLLGNQNIQNSPYVQNQFAEAIPNQQVPKVDQFAQQGQATTQPVRQPSTSAGEFPKNEQGEYVSANGMTESQLRESLIDPDLKDVRPYVNAQLHRMEQARALEQKAQIAEENRAAQIDRDNRKLDQAYEKEEVLPFIKRVNENRTGLPKSLQANEQMMSAIASGDVSPTSWANIGELLNSAGIPEAITNSFRTPGSKEFVNGLKESMSSSIKKIAIRGTVNKAEIKLAQDMNAAIGEHPVAGMVAPLARQAELLIDEEEVRLYDEARDKGLSALGQKRYVDKKLPTFAKDVQKDLFEEFGNLKRRMNEGGK